MIDQSVSFDVGQVKVITTTNRSFSPEEMAELTVDKIISIGENSHPVIIEQAKAFKDGIKNIMIVAFAQAQKAERDTICTQLSLRGRDDISQIIRSL